MYIRTYIHTYIQEVFVSTGLNEMSEDSLAFVLKSDKLKLDELEILEKVKEWASVNAVSVFHIRKCLILFTLQLIYMIVSHVYMYMFRHCYVHA